MDFNSLSRKEKIEYWKKASNMISSSLMLCANNLSEKDKSYIVEYLEHNELGLAAETLIDIAIEEDWLLDKDTKLKILSIFEFMDYQSSDRKTFSIYNKWANDL